MQQNLTRSLPWGLHVLITKAGTAGLQPDVEAFSLFTAAWCSSPVPRCSLRGITVPWGYCVPKGCNSFFLVMAMFCVPFDWVHFFFYGDRASQISISLLDPDINIMTVLREGSSPWVWKQFPPSHSFSVPAGLGISIACLAIMPENPKAISWDEIQREPRSLPYQRVFLLARHPFCSSAHWCCFGEFRSFVMCLRTAFALVVEGIKVLPKCSLNPAEIVSERGNRH